MTQGERDLFNEKLSGITSLMNAHFSDVHDVLNDIKIQTTKTNSRVNGIEKDFLTHPIDCKPSKDIVEIRIDLQEYRMIKKYPKIFIGLVVLVVILTLFSVMKSSSVITKLDETELVIKKSIHEMEGVSKVKRGGYIKYNDSGLSDSIKIGK